MRWFDFYSNTSSQPWCEKELKKYNLELVAKFGPGVSLVPQEEWEIINKDEEELDGLKKEMKSECS